MHFLDDDNKGDRLSRHVMSPSRRGYDALRELQTGLVNHLSIELHRPCA